jgi:hypothetical protein
VTKEFEKFQLVDEILILDSTILIVMEDGVSMEVNALRAVVVIVY